MPRAATVSKVIKTKGSYINNRIIAYLYIYKKINYNDYTPELHDLFDMLFTKILEAVGITVDNSDDIVDNITRLINEINEIVQGMRDLRKSTPKQLDDIDATLKKYARPINNELTKPKPKRNLTRSNSARSRNSTRSNSPKASNSKVDELVGLFSTVKIHKSNSAADLERLLDKLRL